MSCRQTLFAAMVVLGLGATGAFAQGYGSASLYGEPPIQPLYGSVTTTSRLVTNYSPAPYAPVAPVAQAYYTQSYLQPVQPAPAMRPTVCCRHVAAPCAPPVAAYRPAVAYRPVVNVNYAQPYAAYAPAYPAPQTTYAVPTTVASGPRVYVKPKVYIEGQPLRNLITAITP